MEYILPPYLQLYPLILVLKKLGYLPYLSLEAMLVR
jgi:hypothetical protein